VLPGLVRFFQQDETDCVHWWLLINRRRQQCLAPQTLHWMAPFSVPYTTTDGWPTNQPIWSFNTSQYNGCFYVNLGHLTIQQGFNLPQCHWSLINCFRTKRGHGTLYCNSGPCNDCGKCFNIFSNCPQIKLEDGLQRLTKLPFNGWRYVTHK